MEKMCEKVNGEESYKELAPFRKRERIKLIKKNNMYEGDVPSDFFKKENAYCKATKGKCETVLELLDIEKSKTIQSLKDPSFAPSFEWEETYIEMLGNKFYIYNDDFSTKEFVLE